MNERSKHRGFQFRLSTAILATILAGGLIWANVQEHHGSPTNLGSGDPPFNVNFHWGPRMQTKTQGFPLPACGFYEVSGIKYRTWSIQNLSIDFGCAILILAILAAACELSLKFASVFRLHESAVFSVQFTGVIVALLNLIHSEKLSFFYPVLGWPFQWKTQFGQSVFSLNDYFEPPKSIWPPILLNAVVAMAILLIVGVIVEWILRSRDRRKQVTS